MSDEIDTQTRSGAIIVVCSSDFFEPVSEFMKEGTSGAR
jgi:hypothetical protein